MVLYLVIFCCHRKNLRKRESEGTVHCGREVWQQEREVAVMLPLQSGSGKK